MTEDWNEALDGPGPNQYRLNSDWAKYSDTNMKQQMAAGTFYLSEYATKRHSVDPVTEIDTSRWNKYWQSFHEALDAFEPFDSKSFLASAEAETGRRVWVFFDDATWKAMRMSSHQLFGQRLRLLTMASSFGVVEYFNLSTSTVGSTPTGGKAELQFTQTTAAFMFQRYLYELICDYRNQQQQQPQHPGVYYTSVEMAKYSPRLASTELCFGKGALGDRYGPFVGALFGMYGCSGHSFVDGTYYVQFNTTAEAAEAHHILQRSFAAVFGFALTYTTFPVCQQNQPFELAW